MKVQYWGTAATEGIPSVFCSCEVCAQARQRGGRFIRLRSQALIDDSLLIDFGPDTYINALRYGYNLGNLENVIITHVHSDHFTPTEIARRRKDFAHGVKKDVLDIYGSSAVEAAFIDGGGVNGKRVLDEGRVKFHTLEPFKAVEIGRHVITPLPANHGSDSPYIYIIESGEKTALYYHDSGLPSQETFARLTACGKNFDFVSNDCTHGNNVSVEKGGHMGVGTVLYLRERLEEAGLYKQNTLSVLNHFSHNGVDVSYDKFVPIAQKEGFIVSYDGLTVEF